MFVQEQHFGCLQPSEVITCIHNKATIGEISSRLINTINTKGNETNLFVVHIGANEKNPQKAAHDLAQLIHSLPEGKIFLLPISQNKYLNENFLFKFIYSYARFECYKKSIYIVSREKVSSVNKNKMI